MALAMPMKLLLCGENGEEEEIVVSLIVGGRTSGWLGVVLELKVVSVVLEMKRGGGSPEKV